MLIIRGLDFALSRIAHPPVTAPTSIARPPQRLRHPVPFPPLPPAPPLLSNDSFVLFR